MNNRKLSFAAALGAIIMMGAIVIQRYDTERWGWLDFTAIAASLLLMAWLISGRDRASDDEPGESFALRLGKACKRALSGLKS